MSYCCSFFIGSIVLGVKGGEDMPKKSWCAEDSGKETVQHKIETYSPMVYRLAYSLVKNSADADDIHQEVFIRYLKYKPCFENAEHEKAWFLRVTTNQCRNWWKTAWRRRMVSWSEYEEDRGLAARQSKEADTGSELIEVVKALPQKYRVVIHLFYYEQLSVEEIAGILGRKASTVRTQLTRARKKLSEMLREEI